MSENEIVMVGILRLNGGGSEHTHLQDMVYSEEGVAPTLTARDHKDPRRILINAGRHTKDCDSPR